MESQGGEVRLGSSEAISSSSIWSGGPAMLPMLQHITRRARTQTTHTCDIGVHFKTTRTENDCLAFSCIRAFFSLFFIRYFARCGLKSRRRQTGWRGRRQQTIVIQNKTEGCSHGTFHVTACKTPTYSQGQVSSLDILIASQNTRTYTHPHKHTRTHTHELTLSSHTSTYTLVSPRNLQAPETSTSTVPPGSRRRRRPAGGSARG